jgi:hypothetical protein
MIAPPAPALPRREAEAPGIPPFTSHRYLWFLGKVYGNIRRGCHSGEAKAAGQCPRKRQNLGISPEHGNKKKVRVYQTPVTGLSPAFPNDQVRSPAPYAPFPDASSSQVLLFRTTPISVATSLSQSPVIYASPAFPKL